MAFVEFRHTTLGGEPNPYCQRTTVDCTPEAFFDFFTSSENSMHYVSIQHLDNRVECKLKCHPPGEAVEGRLAIQQNVFCIVKRSEQLRKLDALLAMCVTIPTVSGRAPRSRNERRVFSNCRGFKKTKFLAVNAAD
jgi:hypothetical protein